LVAKRGRDLRDQLAGQLKIEIPGAHQENMLERRVACNLVRENGGLWAEF